MELLCNKIIYVISDLHMGCGGIKDNFLPYKNRLISFLDQIEKDSCVILAGDTFEFWQSSHGEVIKAHLDIIKKLQKLNSIFIVGNHDMDLSGFVDLDVEWPFIKSLCHDVKIKRNGKNIFICHGDIFDKYINTDKLILLARMSAMILGWSKERFNISNNGMDDIVEGFLEKRVLDLFNFLSKVANILFRRTASGRVGRGKKICYIRKELDKYHENNPNIFMICGHTHKAGWYKDWHVNTGSWNGKSSYYLRISKNGEITLHEFPSNKICNKKIWKTEK